MTIHDDIRQHLFANTSTVHTESGYGKDVFPERSRVTDLEKLRLSEWSPEFETLMRNRLLMGYFRYGPFNRKDDIDYDRVGSIYQRIKQYKQTGNKEFLVDIANLAMLEFCHSEHPLAHFEAIDDGIHVQKK